MLLSTEEKNEIYIRKILSKYLKNNKLKISELKNPKIFKEFYYVYGFEEMFGYYFVAIKENGEGFLYIKPPQYKNNENGIFYTTEEFNYLENRFFNDFNLESFRNIYIQFIRTNIVEKNISSFLSIVWFRSFPWFKRFNRKKSSKILGAYIFSRIYEFNNDVLNLKKEIDLFNNIQDENFRNTDSMIKAATFTALNIDKILKKEISFISILNHNF